MILDSIRLQNFRAFKGQQHFPLDVHNDKVVTLLFGANGAGKTTLLNAFTWCLYGEMSQDVEEQERIITDCVWREAGLNDEVPVSVEVTFTHGGSSYRARRSATVRKTQTVQQPVAVNLELWVIESGQSKAVDAPQQKVDSILPKRLSRFFFFNGERIDKLVNRRAYAEVKQDIKTLLGLETVERALTHLPKLERKLGAELRKHGGEQAAGIQQDIEKCEERLAELRDRRTTLADHLAELTEERNEVLALLRRHDAAGPLQRQRDETEKQLDAAVDARNKHEIERRYLVGSRGYLAFAGSLSDRASVLASQLHERGALPAPLKREFVDSLIEDARCICGSDLTAGSAALRNVEDWRARAGLAEVEAAWARLSGQVKNIAETRQELRSQFQNLAAQLEQDRTTISHLEGALTELNAQVKAVPLEEVAQLELKSERLEGKRVDANRAIGALDREIEDATSEIVRLKGQLRNAEIGDAIAQTARKRLQLVGTVEAALKEILEIRSADMKTRLDAKVREIFAEITFKPFYPALTDDFELGLYLDPPGGGEPLPVPRSTGENQILSLSFVAAVSHLAREVAARQQGDGGGDDGGSYPIVMDAAFGALDLNYQRDVSRALAKLAPQMIVLVSKSQGQGEVFNQLRPNVSHLGVIVAHTSNDAQPPESIELGGYEYDYIKTKSDSDWAELVEVSA